MYLYAFFHKYTECYFIDMNLTDLSPSAIILPPVIREYAKCIENYITL